MADTVIVALPSEDEKVNKISSEQVAHLTICYLGDQSGNDQLPEIVEYVEHAAKQLSPFYASVDHRGELGPDLADVLFFEPNGWDMKRVREFRYFLLQNDAIRRAYDSVDQHPEWLPHLTLGYPETPAVVDPNDDPPHFYGIQFDRIAVWIGDFQGPEFRLRYEDHAMEVAMSSMTTAQRGEQAVAELFHHGTKGMKWGVRKAEGAQSKANAVQKRADAMSARADRRSSKPGSRAESQKADKLQKEADRLQRRADKKWNKVDAKWEKSIYSTSGAVKVHNAMADHFNQRIEAINAKHPDADWSKGEDAPEWKSYMDDVMKLQDASYSHAVTSVHGNSPSGKKKAVYISDENGERIEVKSVDVKHADGNEPDLVILLKRDDMGRVLEMNTAKEMTMSHTAIAENGAHFASAIFEDDFDAAIHYGKKGMKWGVTTVDRASSVTKTQNTLPRRGAKEITVSQKKAGTFVKSKGGQRHVATDEAVKAQAGRQKAKKSTTDSLTNDELKATVERMRLEQEFHKLARKTERQSIGQKVAEALFGKIGESVIDKAKSA
jgi:hypothetical protein